VATLKLKRIDGDLYDSWNMRFNASILVKPYQLLNLLYSNEEIIMLKMTGAAWLLSARVLRC